MHYNYGNLMKDLALPDEAARHYRAAIRLWPTYSSAHNNLGTVLQDLGAAERHYAEAVRTNPRHAGAHFNLGNLLMDQGRLEEAVSALENSVAIDNGNADTQTSLASVLAQLGRYDEAEVHYARAVQLLPAGADYHNNYGVFLNERGRADEALSMYKRAILLDDTHHVALVNTARALRKLGQTEQAENYLDRALSLHRDAETLDYCGIFYFNQGQNDKALRLFKEALDQNPNRIEAKVHYAQALNLAGDDEGAMLHLADVLRAVPTHQEALHQMALVCGLRGDKQEAIEYLRKAIVVTTDQTDLGTLYFELGNQQKDLEQFMEALQSYSQAVHIKTDIGDAHLNLGVIYHMQGRYKEAQHHYLLAQKMLPNNELLEDNLRKLNRRFIHTRG